jgi:hypothetical protein
MRRELRNRIYDCLKDDVCFADEGILPLRRVNEQPSEAIRSCTLPPGLLALTQVCRQMRSEVVPLYRDCLSRTTVSLKAGDIYDYIDAWVTPASVKKEDIVGRLVLDFPRSYDDTDVVILDVKPLLQLVRRCPRLCLKTYDLDDSRHARQCPRHACIEDTLVDLWDIEDIDKFYDYVEAATNKVDWHDLFGFYGTPTLVFDMEPYYWEAWMDQHSTGDGSYWAMSPDGEAAAVDWARGCGFSFMEEDDDICIMCSPEGIDFQQTEQGEALQCIA